MKLQKFNTLQDYAKARASATCDPGKEYFDSLCEYTYLSTCERITDRFLESENSRIEEAFKNEMVCQAIRSNGTAKDDGDVSLATPGLNINDTDIQAIQISTYGSLAYYLIDDKKNYIHNDAMEIIIPYLKAAGLLPDDISQIDLPESLFFEPLR